jgi:hypothetical protein
MKIKRSKFRRLIHEALLTEVFESEPYDYGGKPRMLQVKLTGQGRSKELTDFKGRQTYQEVAYGFETDSGDEYWVQFTLMTNVHRGLVQELDDPANPDHYFWDISFSVDGEMDMTYSYDKRALPTIAKIIADFYIDVLPNLHDSDVKTFGFVGIRQTHRDDKVQSKRTRVYLGMLKRYARKFGLNISTFPLSRHHASPGSSPADTVLFKIV